MLKVPKPFVDRLAGSAPDSSFVDAILRLGDSLGLATTAEGVEDASQARRLHDLGCRFGQGYFFSPPLAAEDVMSLLAGGAPHVGAPIASLHVAAV